MIQVAIDKSRCTGHGRCYSLAPEVFDADDDGYGTVIAADVPDALEEGAHVASMNCPEEAVIVAGPR